MSPSLRAERKTRTSAVITTTALELFTTRNFGDVTMSEIAAEAGVGERTLYRYFADKEELLFGGDEAFREQLRSAVIGRPTGEEPFTALHQASRSVAAILEGRRVEVARRASVIAGASALLARERAKHAAWEAVLTEALTERGVGAQTARLLGRITVACYDEATTRWLADADQEATLSSALDDGFDEISALGVPI